MKLKLNKIAHDLAVFKTSSTSKSHASSAYTTTLAHCTYPGKSFTYNTNHIGPNIEPWANL